MSRNSLKTLFAGGAVLALAGIATLGLRHGDETKTVRWPVMGTIAQLSIRGTASEGDKIRTLVQSTYLRLDELLSAWNPDSELCRLAASNCTNWVASASSEVKPCYAAALKLTAQSGGAFNPRVGAKLRELGVSGGSSYSDFDLGAIAKGFAVDVAAREISRCSTNTLPDLLIDLGGNLRVVGNGVWRTGIRNPFDRQGPFVGVIALTNGESVATSGNYERFIERDGIRYSHILDGRTGEPTYGIAAVTVVTPAHYGALLADGLSTTLFVLGPQIGADFLARHYPEALALWIPDSPTAPRVFATREMARRLNYVVWPLDALER